MSLRSQAYKEALLKDLRTAAGTLNSRKEEAMKVLANGSDEQLSSEAGATWRSFYQ